MPIQIDGQTKLTFLTFALGCFVTIFMLCSQAINFLTNGYMIYPFNRLEDLIVNTNYSVMMVHRLLKFQNNI